MSPPARARTVTVFSSINQDTLITVPHLPRPGETLLSTHVTTSLGGKGANTAVSAQRSGAHVSLVGTIGTDITGDSVLNSLSHMHSLCTKHIHRTPTLPTGQAFISVDTHGENVIIVNSGANSLMTVDQLHNDHELIARDDVVVMHLEIPHDVVMLAVALARRREAVVVLNAAPAPDARSPLMRAGAAVWDEVDVLVVNEGELQQLVHAAMSTGAGPGANVEETTDTGEVIEMSALTEMNRGIVRDVRRLRAQVGLRRASVVVTLGKLGVVVVRWDGQGVEMVRSVPAVQVQRVVDTTGAGDCFTGFVAGLMAQDTPFDQAVRYAVAAAGVSVCRRGAAEAVPTMREVREVVDGVRRDG